MLIQTRTRENRLAYASPNGFYTWENGGIHLETYTQVGEDDQGPIYWTNVIEWTTKQIAAMNADELIGRIEGHLQLDDFGRDIHAKNYTK